MSAGGAAAAAAIAQAIKASGAIVKVEPSEFQAILARHEEPLVVRAEGGFLGTTYRYLTSYKGLIFFTQNSKELHLPGACEVVQAEKIWVP